MERKQSELHIITKAKDHCSYVIGVTGKSQKHYRYTFVSRLQNLSLLIIENLFRANDTFVSKGDPVGTDRRIALQREAMTDLKVLAYFAMLAMKNGCILPKQYEQIARETTDCQNLLGAWMKSDRKRLQP